MLYLGLDVHTRATVWCLLDATGEVVERGTTPTTAPELEALVKRLAANDDLVCGQEIGTLSYLVHDVLTGAGVRLLSFNAQQLRMIASSRKKTDKRDAYWIAKALQTGMMPHPVYIPTGPVRRLRQLLSRRGALIREQKRWLLRAKTCVRAAGHKLPGKPRKRSVTAIIETLLSGPDGIDEHLAQALSMCERMHKTLGAELAELEATIRHEARGVDALERLRTIPSVGEWVALTVYAWVGDVSRFPNARCLTAYAGLVPGVWQSAEVQRTGSITKQGSAALRTMLIQSGHVLMTRCRSAEAAPLKAIATRVATARKRRKIAVVAAARHLLRIAFYVLRDGTTYDPARLAKAQAPAAA